MEQHLFDTIVAIGTPPGEGGVGIVRLSGPGALPFGTSLFSFIHPTTTPASHRMYLGSVIDRNGKALDRGFFVFMRSPHSYTGEDVVEFHCHGSPMLLETVLLEAIARGARIAEPGEFTRRAFMNGKLDLAQAEAVIDLISSVTKEGITISGDHLFGRLSNKIREIVNTLLSTLAEIEVSIDFPDEELPLSELGEIRRRIEESAHAITNILATFEEGRMYRDGVRVVITGRPNVGKSSLMNLLLEYDRVIVTPDPGTTRDIIEEETKISGIPIRFVDTCGIREALSEAEEEGVKRARRAIADADIILFVVDASGGIGPKDQEILSSFPNTAVVMALNKIDLVTTKKRLRPIPAFVCPTLFTSALTGEGISSLKETIVSAAKKRRGISGESREGQILITNARHFQALSRAMGSLINALEGSGGIKDPEEYRRHALPELVALDLRSAINSLGEVTGEVTNDDVLDTIFSRFCIGK